jgi:hypothetical protein
MHRWTRVLLAAGVVLSAGIAGAALADCPPPVPPASAEQLRAAQQRDRGLLWRLVKDGRESWLYGTLHVGRPEWTEPGPALRRALGWRSVKCARLGRLRSRCLRLEGSIDGICSW